jgi:hypothetical protein
LHRLGRARAGSVAASSGEAATWCAVGVSLAVGAALAIAACASTPRRRSQPRWPLRHHAHRVATIL